MSAAKHTHSIWGNRAKDWAEIQEKQGKDGYDFILNILKHRPKATVLDIGCGSGYFCQLAAEQGLRVSGIDKTGTFLEAARMRVPNARFENADMAHLTFPDKAFDVVCGFNSFQYADDLRQSLLEAKRVLKTNGLLAIMVWGKASDCEVVALLDAFDSLVSPQEKTQHAPFALSEDDTIQQMLLQLEMQSVQTHTVPSSWTYPDSEKALSGILSLGAATRSIEINGIEKVKTTIQQLLPNYTKADGTIVFKNQYKVVLAEKKQTGI